MTHSKAQLRELLLARRLGLPPEVAAPASASICDRLLALPELASARVVLAFWPMTSRQEVDIRGALRSLAARGVLVGLPIIRPSDPARFMAFGAYASDDALRAGPFGTLQPAGPGTLDGRQADAVVVPALGATRDGHRLGYGGGYYDRFLATTDAFTVIPLYSACLVDSFPIEAHDQAVDAVVTESEEIRAPRPT
jgi:5-formyltetrahydrofolate cyclo-ligase